MGAARQLALLAAALLLVGLAVSRISLVAHELVGHGAVVELVGGDVEAWRLFLFGGGWVSYRFEAPPSAADALALSLGGIAVEVVLGGAALLLAARRPPGSVSRVALICLAGLNLLHAGFYLAAGTHHGFGDGRLLHHLLGDRRWMVVAPAAAAVVAGGLWFGRRLAIELAGWSRGRAAARAGLILAAAALAAAGHGALTFGERAPTRDETYAATMEQQSQREVRRDLARVQREAQRAGRPPTAAELAAIRAALERRHRRFPLRHALAAALAAAALAGLWVGARRAATSPGEATAPTRRDLAILATACAAALLLVALL